MLRVARERCRVLTRGGLIRRAVAAVENYSPRGLSSDRISGHRHSLEIEMTLIVSLIVGLIQSFLQSQVSTIIGGVLTGSPDTTGT